MVDASSSSSFWFDAHLDLGAFAVNGRRMDLPLSEMTDEAAGVWPPAGVTLPSLAAGRVKFALATIFTERDGEDAAGYAAGDVEAAYRRGRAQLEVYETWRDEGKVAIDVGRLSRVDPGVGEIRGGMGVSEVTPPSMERRIAPALRDGRLHIGILMENADPIRSPEEMAWWRERGVVAVGLTWGRSSRYATGNSVGPENREGLSDLGREMVRVMDALGVVHDLSHLSHVATEELLGLTGARVMASHSNCRGLLGGDNQRHLADATIVEIARRGGVIGLNLARHFIRMGLEGGERPSVDDALRHVERICFLAGHRRAVGLGSDMDGGFSALEMCAGIECPSDLMRLAEGLSARGWSDAEVEGFMWGNWLRFWCERG